MSTEAEAIEPTSNSERVATKQVTTQVSLASPEVIEIQENESENETKPKIVHLTPDDISNVTREIGAVKWFNVRAGYGFIKRNTGEDIFIHQTAIINNNPTKSERSVREGEIVEFIVIRGVKGPEAAEVTGPELGPVQGSTFARNKGEMRPIRNLRNINPRGSRGRFPPRGLPPPPMPYKPRGPVLRENYFPDPRRYNSRPIYDRSDYREPLPHRNDYLPFRNDRFSMPPESQYYRPDRYFVPRRNNMQGGYNTYQGRDRERDRDRDRDRDLRERDRVEREYNRGRDVKDFDNGDHTVMTTRSPDRDLAERDRNGPSQSRVTVTARGGRFRSNRRWSSNRRVRSDNAQTRTNDTQSGDVAPTSSNGNMEEVTSSLAQVRINGDELASDISSAQDANHVYLKDEAPDKTKIDSKTPGVTGIEA